MNRLTFVVVLGFLPGITVLPMQAQENRGDAVHVPDSSLEGPSDTGVHAHTNHKILTTPAGGLGPNGGMTPNQIRSFYNLPSTGGHGVIAVVDAYDYPSALNDFNVFSKQFGLTKETSTDVTSDNNAVFQVKYQNGRRPKGNTGWAQESALDIEWAHAMAPGAKIVLVEAQSNSFADLFAAVDLATTISGVTQISMSWGGSEFSTETSFDYHFTASNALFFAASGDTGGKTIYPSASPYVVAVGGTSVATNGAGVFTGEKGWSGGGGGPSLYEPRPSWQGVAIPGSTRSVPDIASDADPNTGVSVYGPVSSRRSGWLVFGGTSVSSPCMAGIVNQGGGTYSDTTTLLTAIYSRLGTAYFRDITSGSAGSFSSGTGWDFVTGVGSPQGQVELDPMTGLPVLDPVTGLPVLVGFQP